MRSPRRNLAAIAASTSAAPMTSRLASTASWSASRNTSAIARISIDIWPPSPARREAYSTMRATPSRSRGLSCSRRTSAEMKRA